MEYRKRIGGGNPVSTQSNIHVIDLGDQEAILHGFIDQAFDLAMQDSELPTLSKQHHAAVKGIPHKDLRKARIIFQTPENAQPMRAADNASFHFLSEHLKPFAEYLATTAALASMEAEEMPLHQLRERYRGNIMNITRLRNNLVIDLSTTMALEAQASEEFGGEPGGEGVLRMPARWTEFVEDSYQPQRRTSAEEYRGEADETIRDFARSFADHLRELVAEYAPLNNLLGSGGAKALGDNAVKLIPEGGKPR